MNIHMLGDTLKWTWIPATCSGCLSSFPNGSETRMKKFPQGTLQGTNKNKTKRELFIYLQGFPTFPTRQSAQHMTQRQTLGHVCWKHVCALTPAERHFHTHTSVPSPACPTALHPAVTAPVTAGLPSASPPLCFRLAEWALLLHGQQNAQNNSRCLSPLCF